MEDAAACAARPESPGRDSRESRRPAVAHRTATAGSARGVSRRRRRPARRRSRVERSRGKRVRSCRCLRLTTCGFTPSWRRTCGTRRTNRSRYFQAPIRRAAIWRHRGMCEPFSIDLPSRFGVRPISHLGLGESAVWATVGPVDLGVSTSTQHWGPAERGALVIGPDAPGVPRIFARTSHPVRTRAGSLSATVFAGTLTESRYFDRDDENDLRSLTAWNVAWSSTDSGGFTVGLAHAEQRAGDRFGGGSDSARRIHGPSDQLNEVYAQFRYPRSGIRAWVEIGRAGALPTARQFFTIPYQGITYIVGAERAVALTRRSAAPLIRGGQSGAANGPARWCASGLLHQRRYPTGMVAARTSTRRRGRPGRAITVGIG